MSTDSGSLKATYTIHIRLIGKLVMDFLLRRSYNKNFFSLSVTAETSENRLKVGVLEGYG